MFSLNGNPKGLFSAPAEVIPEPSIRIFQSNSINHMVFDLSQCREEMEI